MSVRSRVADRGITLAQRQQPDQLSQVFFKISDCIDGNRDLGWRPRDPSIRPYGCRKDHCRPLFGDDIKIVTGVRQGIQRWRREYVDLVPCLVEFLRKCEIKSRRPDLFHRAADGCVDFFSNFLHLATKDPCSVMQLSQQVDLAALFGRLMHSSIKIHPCLSREIRDACRYKRDAGSDGRLKVFELIISNRDRASNRYHRNDCCRQHHRRNDGRAGKLRTSHRPTLACLFHIVERAAE
ncbi:hypothetical protein SAMN05444170_6810 [Bradyrhizobium erythrophlei]|uniref:Uncharacterized protein n=1 Tax=Bradyrhizobium erythrophlei TaxID=1437360 RepID=A0A1M7UUT4_9BRAD|nr:hypothetical protein SAMN05444170_6810 [Bradyrhizobium erythrophlei]